MIPVPRPPRPPNFDRDCLTPGNQWLAAHPNARANSFPAHWTKFSGELEAGFGFRCGWWAMEIQSGTVDHYLSKNKAAHRHFVYEWDNYRHAAPTLNSSKKELDDQVLDPFEVQPGWFKVLLFSMELVRTEAVPENLRTKADFTIKRLHLDKGPKLRLLRKRYYEKYKSAKINLAALQEFAPLVAEAVVEWNATGRPLP
jgi:hypothetical protein